MATKLIFNTIFYILFLQLISCNPETIAISQKVCDVATEICFYSNTICNSIPQSATKSDSLLIIKNLQAIAKELSKFVPDSITQKYKYQFHSLIKK